jgi:hypothetical protein
VGKMDRTNKKQKEILDGEIELHPRLKAGFV